MEQKEKKLEVKNLVISFKTVDGKVQAVRDISFDLYKGETLAIVGESGSGKSVTSKAIIGISSGNAIIEKGEILYDGQDLLRISEDDFHKLRGDKIAMIFQDPLSSLDPIVKVGTQLTEAMILKNHAFRKNSKIDFNNKLECLLSNLNEYEEKHLDKPKEEIEAENKKLTQDFNELNLYFINLENEYNNAVTAGEEVAPDLDYIILLYEKEQKEDYVEVLKKIVLNLEKTIHPFFVKKEEMSPIIETLSSLDAKITIPSKKNDAFRPEAVEVKNKIIENVKAAKKLIVEAGKKEVPNYFTIGYYAMNNSNIDINTMDVHELNIIAREYTDEHFLLSFINKTALALQNAEEKANEGKKKVIERFEKEIGYFSSENIDKKECALKTKELIALVDESINYLSVTKDSLAYTFKYTFKVSLQKYFDSFKYNKKENRRFERETKRYNAKTKNGKQIGYKVSPLALVDADSQLKQVCIVLSHIIDGYKVHLAKEETNYHQQAVSLIDFFKEKAKGVTHFVTRRSARAKAIKLMEEVGIPEPTLRFKQYPFEFSGGMRQRIVIAIALAADPDILICDEPTTALDVTIQSQILELINKIKAERQLSIIFITHDLGVVANMADKIAVMYAGRIVEYGTDDDIFYNPRHPYTWALLASMPDLNTKERLEAIPGTPPNMIYPPKGDAFAIRNKYALKIDFEQQPPMFKVSDTHYAATWLLHKDAPKVEMPKIVAERIARMKKQHGGEEDETK